MRTEQELNFLEEHIPLLAENAFQKAYINALSSGSNVLESNGHEIIEISSDGSQKTIKQIIPDIVVDRTKKRVFR